MVFSLGDISKTTIVIIKRGRILQKGGFSPATTLPPILGTLSLLTLSHGFHTFPHFLYGEYLFYRFPPVTPEPGLQSHVNFKVRLCHVLRKPSPKGHDLCLLRKALFPWRYWAVTHAKTAFLSLGYMGYWYSGTFLSTRYMYQLVL